MTNIRPEPEFSVDKIKVHSSFVDSKDEIGD